MIHAAAFLLALAAASPEASGTPRVTRQRVLDRRGAEVARVVRVEETSEAGTHSLWLVEGLLRDDVLLRSRRPAPAEARSTSTEAGISLSGRPGMWFETSPDGRVTATAPDSSFRFFREDAATRTVVCNLFRLADGTDPALTAAVEELRPLAEALPGLFDDVRPAIGLIPLRSERPPGPPPERRLEDAGNDPTLDAMERRALDAFRSDTAPRS